MDAIRRFFVTAKHWQLFLVAWAFAVTGLLLAAAPLWRGRETIVGFWIPVTALNVVVSIYAILWVWSYGSFLSSVTPEAVRLKLRFFRIAISFFFIYMPLSSAVPVRIWNWFIPLDLFALFCALYAAFFVARSLIFAETGKRGTFTDYLRTFLLLWFWPIGIWSVQPRINRLFVANRTMGAAPLPS